MANWKEVALVEDLAGFALADSVDNAIPFGDGSGGFDYTSAGTNNQILTVNGAHPQFVAMSGDATITAAGALALTDNAVVTDTITDNAVTLDKLAGLDKGHIIYGDASGNPASLPEGSNGEVLTLASGMPAWASAGSVTSITVNESDDNASHPLTFTDSGAGAGAILEQDNQLHYNPSTNVLTAVTFSGALSGNATSADTVDTTTVTNGDTLFVPLVDSSTGVSGETLETCSAITVVTGGGFLSDTTDCTVTISGDLVVSGDTTTINTATLKIEDKTIVCASGATAVENAGTSGLVVNGGSAADANNPRFIWSNNGGGTADSSTTLGWAIADHGGLVGGGSTGATTSGSTLRNIAPTLINQSGAPSTLAIGRGSMYLTHAGTSGADSKLYIQVD